MSEKIIFQSKDGSGASNCRILTLPAVYRFPKLNQSIRGTNCADWDWFDLRELQEAVISRFRKFDTTLEYGTQLAIDYASFAEFLSTKNGNEPFTWIEILFVFGILTIHECRDEFSKLCFCTNIVNTTFVPAQWGNEVLEIAKLGIKQYVRTVDPSGWKAILWDGRVIDDVDKSHTTPVTPAKSLFGNEEEWLLAALLDYTKATSFGFSYFDLQAATVDPEAIAKIPSRLAWKLKAIAVSYEEKSNTLTVTITDPSELDTIDMLNHLLKGYNLYIVVSTPEDIEVALHKYYPKPAPVEPSLYEDPENHLI